MSDLGNKDVFAANLKRYMRDYKMNRADLASRLNVSYSTVNDWYNSVSYPRIDKIEEMAKMFRVSKSSLIEKNAGDITSDQKYLMDKIIKADDRKIDKIKRLMELIDDEEDRNWK